VEERWWNCEYDMWGRFDRFVKMIFVRYVWQFWWNCDVICVLCVGDRWWNCEDNIFVMCGGGME